MEWLLCLNLCYHWGPVNTVPVNALLWNRVSGWKNPKMLPLCSRVDGKSAYFAYWWRHCPTPWPLASDLWTLRRLITTTTTSMADYGLCSCFLQLTRLVVKHESQQQFSLIIGPHKRLWFPCTSHFHLLLVVFGFSVYCLFTVCKLYVHVPSLLLCFWWISSATYRSGIWTTACWVIYSGSVWMQMFLKWCQGRWGPSCRGKKDHFGMCGHGLSPSLHNACTKCMQHHFVKVHLMITKDKKNTNK